MSRALTAAPAESATEVATATLRCDLHLHTSDDPYDRIAHDVFQLVDRARELDYHVLAVTNHLAVARRQDAQDYARERGILLLSGVELTIKGRHVLFINPPDDLDPEKVRRFEDLRPFRREESLVIPAHPFYPGPVHFGDLVEEHAELWDAVELCHFYTRTLDFNRRTRQVANRLDLPLVATSDTHHLATMGSSHTEVEAAPDALALARAIRRGGGRPWSRPRRAVELLKVGWRTYRCGGTSPAPPGHGRAD